MALIFFLVGFLIGMLIGAVYGRWTILRQHAAKKPQKDRLIRLRQEKRDGCGT